MYHTKMYPKFLLLPKCSKIKSYINPLIETKITSYKKVNYTQPIKLFYTTISKTAFSPKANCLMCLYKNVYQYTFSFISLYKAK